VTFAQSCPEALPVCLALCCRLLWDILLTPGEAASGQYEHDRICALTRLGCAETVPECVHRICRLKRSADGACIYLGADNLCSIYERRLTTCRPQGYAPATACRSAASSSRVGGEHRMSQVPQGLSARV